MTKHLKVSIFLLSLGIMTATTRAISETTPEQDLVLLKAESTWDVLKLAAPYLPEAPVILDCGAFLGIDTEKMARYWPQGFVHAFEPDPEIFGVLQKKCSNHSNTACYQLAIGGDTPGTMQFHTSRAPERQETLWGSGSLMQPTERYQKDIGYVVKFNDVIDVEVVTLEGWAKKSGVEKIDFMWLDMQGYELNMLKASQTLLKSVSAIFTEVFFRAGYEGQAVYTQMKAFFENAGFTAIAQDFTKEELALGQRSEGTRREGNVLFVRK